MKWLMLVLYAFFLSQSLYAVDNNSQPDSNRKRCMQMRDMFASMCSVLAPRRFAGTSFCEHVALFVATRCVDSTVPTLPAQKSLISSKK